MTSNGAGRFFRWELALLAAALLLGTACSVLQAPPTATPTPVSPRELTGAIVYPCDPESVLGCQEALPRDGNIDLVDITEIDFTYEFPPHYVYEKNVIATGELTSASGLFPVPFRIIYDAEDIDAERDYAITVRYVRDDGGDLFIKYSNVAGKAQQPTPVLTKGRPGRDVEVKIDIIIWIIN